MSSVHIGGAVAVDGRDGEQDTWSAWAGGLVGIETKITDPVVGGIGRRARRRAPASPLPGCHGEQRFNRGRRLGTQPSVALRADACEAFGRSSVS